MWKFETEGRGALGYFLPEDGHAQLHKLQQHLASLSRLAPPRVDNDEDGPDSEIEVLTLAGCMKLLAGQVQEVLDGMAGPARLRADGRAVVLETTRDLGGDPDGDAPTVPVEPDASAAPAGDFTFGMTMDQLDEANRLLDLLGAQGDLLMAGGGGDLAGGTVIVIGAAIFDGADAMKDMTRQIESQVLAAQPGAGARLREMSTLYDFGGGVSPVYGPRAHAAVESSATRVH